LPQHHVGIDYRWESPFDLDQFTSEITHALESNPNLDSLTFGYYGEPTLSKFLHEAVCIAQEVKKNIFSESGTGPKISILTNSSTLTDPNICSILKKFDWVIAKLDCALDFEFRGINRPHNSVPNITTIIKALELFNHDLHINTNSLLSIQTLLLDSSNRTIPSNCSPAHLEALCTAFRQILPDSIQITTVSRIPPNEGVHALVGENKQKIRNFFEERLPYSLNWKLY
jgi:wyosine [tRNA(Phe)-imidazoG37] synthetase (radical SAM superfamily)